MATPINTSSTGATQSTGSPQSPQTVRHSEYYREGGDLYILISHIIFRLHSADFPQTFFEAFNEGKPLGPTIDTWPGVGACSEFKKAIIIDPATEATPDEFAKLAWVIHNPLYDDFSAATLEDWFTILRLADKWGFTGMKAMAQRHIHPRAEQEIPDILDRLCKYEAYKLPADMIQELYIQLCTQEEGLSDENLDRLDNLPRGRMGRQVQRGREAYYKAQIENGGNELTDSRKKTVIVGALGLENRPQSTSNANGSRSAGQAPSTASDTTPAGGPNPESDTSTAANETPTESTSRDTASSSANLNGGTSNPNNNNNTNNSQGGNRRRGSGGVIATRKPDGGLPMSTFICGIVYLNLVYFWKLL